MRMLMYPEELAITRHPEELAVLRSLRRRNSLYSRDPHCVSGQRFSVVKEQEGIVNARIIFY
jgi:hypothetical protein